jgi:hypothetical protein
VLHPYSVETFLTAGSAISQADVNQPDLHVCYNASFLGTCHEHTADPNLRDSPADNHSQELSMCDPLRSPSWRALQLGDFKALAG